MVTYNPKIGDGETLIIKGTLTIDGVEIDLTDYTITWAGTRNGRDRLWWKTGTVSGTEFTLSQDMNFGPGKIDYDVCFKNDGTTHYYLKGIIHVESRVTPSGTP